jgi:hypothetical protein
LHGGWRWNRIVTLKNSHGIYIIVLKFRPTVQLRIWTLHCHRTAIHSVTCKGWDADMIPAQQGLKVRRRSLMYICRVLTLLCTIIYSRGFHCIAKHLLGAGCFTEAIALAHNWWICRTSTINMHWATMLPDCLKARMTCVQMFEIVGGWLTQRWSLSVASLAWSSLDPVCREILKESGGVPEFR